MRKAALAFDRFTDRWFWLLCLALTVGTAVRGDAEGAALLGLLSGVKIQQRISPRRSTQGRG